MTRWAIVLLLVSSCAPVALNRTARPLAAGETQFGIGLSVPITLVEPCPSPNPSLYPCFGEFDPGFLPKAGGFAFQLASGLDGQNDLHFGLSLSPLPMLRVGGKSLVFGIPQFFAAFDYGLTLFYPGAGLDAGLILSFPLESTVPGAARVRPDPTLRELERPSLERLAHPRNPHRHWLERFLRRVERLRAILPAALHGLFDPAQHRLSVLNIEKLASQTVFSSSNKTVWNPHTRSRFHLSQGV